MFPSVIPKAQCSRQSTCINSGYTKIAKLILHPSNKVNAVTTRDRAKALRDAWTQRVLLDQDGKRFLRGRKTKPSAAKPNDSRNSIGHDKASMHKNLLPTSAATLRVESSSVGEGARLAPLPIDRAAVRLTFKRLSPRIGRRRTSFWHFETYVSPQEGAVAAMALNRTSNVIGLHEAVREIRLSGPVFIELMLRISSVAIGALILPCSVFHRSCRSSAMRSQWPAAASGIRTTG
jgi:hypothetical protein